MKSLTFLLTCVCTVIILVSCSGSSKRDRAERPPPVPETTFVSTMHDTKPFNMNTERLPPGYTGHNPDLLYNAIRLRQEAVKGRPGETGEQHRSRIASEIYAPLLGSVNFDSMYAFRITPSKRAYNAGLKTLEVSSGLVLVFEKGLEGRKRALVVRYQPQLDNAHVTTDKGGSKRVIEEKKFSQYAVVPVDKGGVPVETRDMIATTITMTPEEVQKAGSDVMFLIIGTLQSPYISYEEIHRNPLAGTSGTYLGRYHYLHIHIVDIWVYDLTSGKILQKESQVSGFTFQEKGK